jgi:hypothetical protein
VDFKKNSRFLKKAAQKRLLILAMGAGAAAAHGQESKQFFGSFFQKRTASFLELFPINRKRSGFYLASNFIRYCSKPPSTKPYRC